MTNRQRLTAVALLALALAAIAFAFFGMVQQSESAPLLESNIPPHFNVTVTEADCSTEFGCWRLERVVYLSEDKSGGTHHIYTDEPHDPYEFMEIEVMGTTEVHRVALDKPQDEPAGNFAMFAGSRYCAKLVGAPSDEICNLYMRGPTPETEHEAHHISHHLFWRFYRFPPPDLPFRLYLPPVLN